VLVQCTYTAVLSNPSGQGRIEPYERNRGISTVLPTFGTSRNGLSAFVASSPHVQSTYRMISGLFELTTCLYVLFEIMQEREKAAETSHGITVLFGNLEGEVIRCSSPGFRRYEAVI